MSGRTTTVAGVLLAILLMPVAAQAQSGFGIGPRLTFVRGSSEVDDGSQRFSGGAVRLGAGRAALEVAMDFRSDVSGDLTEKIKDYPIQASALLFLFRRGLSPYAVGGVGWYSQRVERLGPIVQESETTRKMGYHAGFGAELLLHRHVGIYGDYRYTMLGFGDDDDDEESSTPSLIPFAERLKLSHEGSMFTWGATFYF